METAVRVKLTRKLHAEGLALAEKFLKRLPGDTELMALKSACLAELGRDKQALSVMEAALAADPNDASLNNNLGYMYAERGIQLVKARRMIRVALEGRPGEPAFTDSLAWVYYKQGLFRDAGRIFQRLLRARQDEEVDHGVIYDHAGDAYWRLGWKDRAVEFWKRALELVKKAKNPASDETALLKTVPAKIEAARKGQEPAVAPTGEPATEPARAPASQPAREGDGAPEADN